LITAKKFFQNRRSFLIFKAQTQSIFNMKKSRRHFIKQTAITGAGMVASKLAWTAQSYNRIIGANDRVRVGVVGFSDRHRSSHLPLFYESL
jgi:hypothetical protein